MHLSQKSSGPELEESTTNNARIGFRTEEFCCEHPASARCLGSNGKTTTTAHTKPVRQFDAGLITGQYVQHQKQGKQIEVNALTKTTNGPFG